jgi:hypothetical protein
MIRVLRTVVPAWAVFLEDADSEPMACLSRRRAGWALSLAAASEHANGGVVSPSGPDGYR